MSHRDLLFRETIYPSLGVTISLVALDLAMSFALWAALGELPALAFLLLALLLSALWWRSVIHRTSLDEDYLYVNQARIERRFLGRAEALESTQWGKRLGVDFNPRLFHAHKFWMKSGVEIVITDSQDPHPGWLIGCKGKSELAELINSSRMNY